MGVIPFNHKSVYSGTKMGLVTACAMGQNWTDNGSTSHWHKKITRTNLPVSIYRYISKEMHYLNFHLYLLFFCCLLWKNHALYAYKHTTNTPPHTHTDWFDLYLKIRWKCLNFRKTKGQTMGKTLTSPQIIILKVNSSGKLPIVTNSQEMASRIPCRIIYEVDCWLSVTRREGTWESFRAKSHPIMGQLQTCFHSQEQVRLPTELVSEPLAGRDSRCMGRRACGPDKTKQLIMLRDQPRGKCKCIRMTPESPHYLTAIPL